MFSDTCTRLTTWHNMALAIMKTEVDKKNNVFLQDGKRVTYSQGSREGPDKGLCPHRDETQVISNRTEAENTGETTCGNTKDLLSRTDTHDEMVSFQRLKSAALIDLSTIQKLGDPGQTKGTIQKLGDPRQTHRYSQGSPNRDETQIIRDRTEAEKTGETTCGYTKDMLSKTDTHDEIVNFQWLQSAALIDMSTIQKRFHLFANTATQRGEKSHIHSRIPALTREST